MSGRRFVVLAFLVCVLAAGTAGAQTTLAGDWELTIESPQGARTIPVSLTQDGEKLAGLFKSPAGELPLAGTLTGPDVKLTFTVNMGGTPLDIVMTGKVDGETFAGKADFGGMAEGTFSAKRPDAAAAAAPAATAPDAAAAPMPTGNGSSAALAGTWDVTVKTATGDYTITALLTEDAGKVAGTFQTQMGEMAVSGTHEGHALKLSMVAKTPQGDIPVSLTGDVDGDSITNGKAEFGGMAGEWTAKRKQ